MQTDPEEYHLIPGVGGFQQQVVANPALELVCIWMVFLLPRDQSSWWFSEPGFGAPMQLMLEALSAVFLHPAHKHLLSTHYALGW